MPDCVGPGTETIVVVVVAVFDVVDIEDVVADEVEVTMVVVAVALLVELDPQSQPINGLIQ
jgi:hypothetical protein